MANLGFIGLGVMGGEMVNRLLGKGHNVTGYNRTRSKSEWLVKKGMKWADSPRGVAAAADVTFSMVTNSAALGAVANGPDGFLAGLTKGKILIDMSTVSPTYSREIAARVREKGAEMVDAPVSGSVITLQEGKLSVMVGGRKETFEKVKPLLLDIGPKVTHVGDNGLALAMKIAVNLSLAVQMLAFSEGVLLAEKSGVAGQERDEVGRLAARRCGGGRCQFFDGHQFRGARSGGERSGWILGRNDQGQDSRGHEHGQPRVQPRNCR
jgi:3-hydroxyisobutyrate dehydrogenase-like beta-hydroxyacid dehydrogenase